MNKAGHSSIHLVLLTGSVGYPVTSWFLVDEITATWQYIVDEFVNYLVSWVSLVFQQLRLGNSSHWMAVCETNGQMTKR